MSTGRQVVSIGLLGLSFDTCNMGVSALTEGSIKAILSRWPDAQVTLLGSSRAFGEHRLKISGKELRVRRLPVRFCKNIFLSNHFLVLAFYAFLLRLLPFRTVRNYLMKRNPYLKSILQLDFFADMTGGDSFSDIYGMQAFILGFFKKLLPILFSKKLVMLPQTYGPYKRPMTKLLARYILSYSDLIYSRDRAGVAYVNELLNGATAGKEVRFAPDVGFVLNPQRPPSMDIGSLPNVRTDKSVIVGLNVSGLLYHGGYTRDNMFGLKEDYKQIICRIIDFMMAKENFLLLLIPHVFAPIGHIESDVAACLDMYEKFSAKYPARVFMVRGRYDQRQIKYIIGLCDFFLGSRMHSCIAALSQCIPAVGIAYSKKFQGVFESVGLGHCVADARNCDEKQLLEKVESVFEHKEQIREHLRQVIPQVKEDILGIFHYWRRD